MMINKTTFIFFILVIFFSLTGCTEIIRSSYTFHPDTCENSLCKLESIDGKVANTMEVTGKKDVEVCACRTWNVSSIKVNKYEQYSFRVKKVLEPWEDGGIPANPHDGWIDNKLLGMFFSFLQRNEDAKWYQLVGSIGKGKKARTFLPLDYYGKIESDSLDEKEHNENLFIDNQVLTINPEEEGNELYFYANDTEGRYANNKGKLILEVTRLK